MWRSTISPSQALISSSNCCDDSFPTPPVPSSTALRPIALLSVQVDDLFFDRASCHQPIHGDGTLLPDAMGPV